MRFIIILVATLLALINANGQTPLRRNMALVQKATGSWCNACGNWGWELQERIANDYIQGQNQKACVISVYGPSYSNYYADCSPELSGWVMAYPNWAVNNRNLTPIQSANDVDTVAFRQRIKSTVDSIAAAETTVSTGFNYTIEDSVVTLNTQTRFWKDVNGTYSLAIYILEDSIYGYQNGHSDTPYHNNVLRGKITSDCYGAQIGRGTILANSVYSKTFTYTIRDSSWNKAHLRFVTVIWRQNGSDWQIENVNSRPSTGSELSVTNVAGDVFSAYPNPASTFAHIKWKHRQLATGRILLINTLGKTVFERVTHGKDGEISAQIDLNNIANGIYLVVLESGSMRYTRSLSVSR